MLPQLHATSSQSLTASQGGQLTVSQAIAYFRSVMPVSENYPRIVRRYLEFCIEHRYGIDSISFSLYAAGKKGNLVSPVKKFLRFAQKYSITSVIADSKLPGSAPAANAYILAFLSDAGSLRGEKSKETYKTALNDFYAYLPGGAILFSYHQVEAYLHHLRKEKKSAFTINNYLSSIRQFAKWLIKRREQLNLHFSGRELELMGEVSSVKGLTVEGKYFKEDLSFTERELLIENIDDLRVRAMMALMAYCGLRTVELTRLSIFDVDLSGGRLYVLGKGAATKRTIKLFTFPSLILAQYINSLPRQSGNQPLFEALTTRQIRYYSDKYLKALGLKRKGISAHSMRHTAAQRLLDKGADLMHVKNQLGHKRLSTTQFYIEKQAEKVFLDSLPDE